MSDVVVRLQQNLEFSGQIFTEVPLTRLHGNLSSGNHADTYVLQTDGHDEAKGAVRDYENVPQNKHNFRRWKPDSSCPLSGCCMHGRKISRRFVMKVKFRTGTLIVWLAVGCFGGLWARTWAFRLRKRRGISCVSELLLTSQIELCLVY
jgi:hypothetical protein